MSRATNYKNSETHNRIRILVDEFEDDKGKTGNISKFAEYIGRSKQMVGYWYNGDRMPGIDVIVLLSKKCNVSTDWILGRNNIDNRSADSTISGIATYTGLSSSAVESLHAWSNNEKFAGNDVIGFSANNDPWVSMISDLIEKEAIVWNGEKGGFSVLSRLYTYLMPEGDHFALIDTKGKGDKKKRESFEMGVFADNQVFMVNQAGSFPVSAGLASRFFLESLEKELARYKNHIKDVYGTENKSE